MKLQERMYLWSRRKQKWIKHTKNSKRHVFLISFYFIFNNKNRKLHASEYRKKYCIFHHTCGKFAKDKHWKKRIGITKKAKKILGRGWHDLEKGRIITPGNKLKFLDNELIL